MDNLTHSLVGALIGQMGLKRKTGLAMPTLIIAANIPDIDAVATLLGGHQHLAIRRGISHGPIAMVVLPLMLWGIMLWFDRWQARRGKRPDKRLPIHKGWLLALAYIGCLSHPLFDWFNSYGIRLLEPFSSQWFYGDSIFIIDVWILAGLIAGIWLSKRRENNGTGNPFGPSRIAASTIAVYICANLAITSVAEQYASNKVYRKPSFIAANPVPVAFWQREMLWQNEFEIGSALFSFLTFGWTGEKRVAREPLDERVGEATAADPEADAFIFWSRMELVTVKEINGVDTAIVTDQRFTNPWVVDRFTVKVPLPKKAP